MASARFGKAKDRAFSRRKSQKGDVIVSPGKLLSQLSNDALIKLAKQKNIPKDAHKARKEMQKRNLDFPIEDASLV